MIGLFWSSDMRLERLRAVEAVICIEKLALKTESQ